VCVRKAKLATCVCFHARGKILYITNLWERKSGRGLLEQSSRSELGVIADLSKNYHHIMVTSRHVLSHIICPIIVTTRHVLSHIICPIIVERRQTVYE